MIKIIIILSISFLSIFANNDFSLFQESLVEEFGVLSVLFGGFSIDNLGILSLSPSAFAIAIIVLSPLFVYLVVKKYDGGQYNDIISALSLLVVLLIAGSGLFSEAKVIQQSYEKKLAKKYKVDQPVSIFFGVSQKK